MKKQLKSISHYKKAPPSEARNMHLKSLLREDIDFDVYLPSHGMNLQRDYCWTYTQKDELIKSVLFDRCIPPIAVNLRGKEGSSDDVVEIIDGKQRLSTMLAFQKGEIDVEIDGELYKFEELPKDWQIKFNSCSLPVLMTSDLTEQEKIKWFLFLNKAGTPQDEGHCEAIANLV